MKWFKVFDSLQAAEQKVPTGGTQLLIAKGRRICLARTENGFFAIDNACPHMGESLHKGVVNYLDEVVCPWHNYRFHLGNGQECKNRAPVATRHTVEIREDGLYLGVKE